MKPILYSLLTFAILSSCIANTYPLENTKWRVVWFKRNGVKTELPNTMTVQFAEGNFSASLDANTCSGTYLLKDRHGMAIENIGCTKICCDDEKSVMALQALGEANNYRIVGSTLRIENEGLKVVLRADE
ncbi:META domain-containing protein [bacterium]|nr:META domain-containing protein [bacterium]